ncbi:MAG: beta-phosphoglucomutase [Anaerolineae bacterium]
MPIKAFIFDLDGVLTDTSEYHYRAWKRLADELGIPFDRQRNEALRGVSRRRSLELLLDGRPATEAQMEEWMERKNRYYVEFLQRLTPDDLLPGALALLEEIRQAGLKVGIASASKNTRTVLDRLNLWPLADAVSDGTHGERTKPAPDLFLHCARQLGVAPEEAVVVEDAAAGVEAALAGGFWAVGLGPLARVGAAHAVFPSLEGVSLAHILARLPVPTDHVPIDPWRVVETEFRPERLPQMETVFTLGNGYLGTRGAFEEGYPGDTPATLVHGVFDDHPLVYTELVNFPNGLPLTLVVEGEQFRLDRGTVLAYRRELDLRTGVLTRLVRWRSPAGHTLDLKIERFASLDDPHLLVVRLRATALDFAGTVELRAGLNGYAFNPELYHWRPVDQGAVGPQAVYLHTRTRNSGIEACLAAHLSVAAPEEVAYAPMDCENAPAVVARTTVRPGDSLVAEKRVALYTSRDVSDVREATLAALKAAVARPYSDLRAAHEAAWAREWESCDVVLEGDDRAQQAVRHSLFQLLIAAPRGDDRVSIPARTLSGFGYRGHVFWDTDTFILPFFTFTRPEIARNLLMYRYHTLPGARRKAQRHGYEGAMYAWESADTGDETTPRWVPVRNGDLVRIWCGDIEDHITADVAYAVVQYWQVTGDDAFIRDYGAEIVLETARFWASRARWNEEQGRYEIRDVIGPDEYHEHVDNNAYTNGMARWNLEAALEVLAWLRERAPQKAADLESRLGLTEDVLRRWTHVIEHLYIPYDPESGLIEQFEGFFDREDLDLSAYEPRPVSMQVLLGIEGVQRYQVLKQPDVLMLLYLLRDRYDPETVRCNWEYYTPRTDLSHGSSLGPAIHALLAARMGDLEEAYRHWMHAALTDLEDLRGNTADGFHAATAGGLWQALVFGFAGLEVRDGHFTLAPRLPPHWRRLAFSVRIRGQRVEVDISP